MTQTSERASPGGAGTAALAVTLVQRVRKLLACRRAVCLCGKRLLPAGAAAIILGCQKMPAGAAKCPNTANAGASAFASGRTLMIGIVKHTNVGRPATGATAQAISELACSGLVRRLRPQARTHADHTHHDHESNELTHDIKPSGRPHQGPKVFYLTIKTLCFSRILRNSGCLRTLFRSGSRRRAS